MCRSHAGAAKENEVKVTVSSATASSPDANNSWHGNSRHGLFAFKPGSQHEGTSAGWGRGIRDDFKRTVGTHWVKEMTNFNMRTVAVSFFIFFACIAPAITFGAMYAKFTNDNIGAVEMIVATAWCGIAYAVIGGQPMMINGGTGPVLAFTGVLYSLSKSLDVPFLAFNAWVGLWVGVYMLIGAVVDLNRYMHLATRFTDDIFSALISVIFIVNAIGSPTAPVGLYYYFEEGHASHERNVARITKEAEGDVGVEYSHFATAFLSCISCIGTTWLALKLREIKTSPYLTGPMARRTVADFAVVGSIFIWTLIDHYAFPTVATERLNAPAEFAPTFQCCNASCVLQWPDDCPDQAEAWGRRAWLVSLGDLNGKGWVPLFAAVPALLAFILVFLDDGITWHLINRPENKLTHGAAYNYDTVLVGLMIVVNSLLGLPWLVAATVRSMNHLQAMADKGEKGVITYVQQTRLTHLFIHVLVLVAIFLMNAVRQIPVPVLYGVFLYMGITSLSSNQFLGRVMMFVMQPSKYPSRPYTGAGAVSVKAMHTFTLLQFALFALLYIVKSVKPIAIAFPLIIAACIPMRRHLLPRIFSKRDLVLLDGDDDEINELHAAEAKEGSAYEGELTTASATTEQAKA